MTVLYIVLPLALVIVAVAVWAFVWAAHRGQFDDLDTPAMRLLHDDRTAEAVRERSASAPASRPRDPS